jgi:hypothetical protein
LEFFFKRLKRGNYHLLPSKVVHQELSIPLKRKKKASEPTILLEQKKKRTKGKDGEAKVKHHSKGHPSLAHICT